MVIAHNSSKQVVPFRFFNKRVSKIVVNLDLIKKTVRPTNIKHGKRLDHNVKRIVVSHFGSTKQIVCCLKLHIKRKVNASVFGQVCPGHGRYLNDHAFLFGKHAGPLRLEFPGKFPCLGQGRGTNWKRLHNSGEDCLTEETKLETHSCGNTGTDVDKRIVLGIRVNGHIKLLMVGKTIRMEITANAGVHTIGVKTTNKIA